ncbi:MAG: hypothetical protein OXK79_00980 [Chloroflexota bacterium]|nr:hypothetical protein [Chloroflexota bacterium]
MNEDRTFWECVYDARFDGLIPSVWRKRELIELLTPPLGRFSPNTVNTLPSNESISLEGNEIGFFVKGGTEPKAWRVGRGKFRLVVDPEDDADQQSRHRELAKKRADELRAQVRRPAGQRTRVAALQSSRLGQPGFHTSTESNALLTDSRRVRASGQYNPVSVALDATDLQEMEGLRTEQKALYIVEKHIRSEHGERVEIEEDRDGADLRISVGGQTVKRIEVKGTRSQDLAWQKLKVSSQKSHDALKSGDVEMYRVVDVDGEHPSIYVLMYGHDFTLEPEPRWAVKQTTPEHDRYPLRGRPYRYDQPYDPVAQDEWEALE